VIGCVQSSISLGLTRTSGSTVATTEVKCARAGN